MKLLGYAAAFSFTVRYTEGVYNTCIERITFSCEHVHETIVDAAACAHAQCRAEVYQGTPWWNPYRKIEDEGGEPCYEEIKTPEEVAEIRDAYLSLSGWRRDA
jgi:hypothetical protein